MGAHNRTKPTQSPNHKSCIWTLNDDHGEVARSHTGGCGGSPPRPGTPGGAPCSSSCSEWCPARTPRCLGEGQELPFSRILKTNIQQSYGKGRTSDFEIPQMLASIIGILKYYYVYLYWQLISVMLFGTIFCVPRKWRLWHLNPCFENCCQKRCRKVERSLH